MRVSPCSVMKLTIAAVASGVVRSTLLGSRGPSRSPIYKNDFLNVVGTSRGVTLVQVASVLNQTEFDQRVSSRPSSLEAYCAQGSSADTKEPASTKNGKQNGYVVGQTVQANWLEFGVWYDAVITRANSDGTYNVIYDMDDMSERGVSPAMMKPRKTGPKDFDPSEDPACMLKDEVESLNRDIDRAAIETAKWLAENRRKRKKKAQPKVEAATEVAGQAVGKSSAQTVPSPAQANVAPPKGVRPAVGRYGIESPAPAPATANERRKEQEEEKFEPVTLQTVIECSFEVKTELEKIKLKEHELAEHGTLDPELKKAVKDASKRIDKLDGSVEKVKRVAATTKAIERDLAEARKAIQASKKANVPPPQKYIDAEKNALMELEAADREAVEHVEELQESLRSVKQSARNFDTNVHPNGAKWWRFRYEYSYIEAMLMLFIIPFMHVYKLLWDLIALEQRKKADSLWVEGVQIGIDEMRVTWQNEASEEMFACFCVVITIWLLSTFGQLDFLVVYVHDDQFHLPTESEQYRWMAINVANQLGLALLCYHALVYSVVSETTRMFTKWTDSYNQEEPEEKSVGLRDSILSGHAMSTALGVDTISTMKRYFINVLSCEHYADTKEKFETIAPVDDDFPFLEYISLSLRLFTDHILEMTHGFWIATWFTFGIFMLLHRFGHLAYVRIMSFFAVMLVAVCFVMGFLIRRMIARMERWENCADVASQIEKEPVKVHKFRFEMVVSTTMQFTIFFLCYGFVRMVTSPWIWSVYFYNVLILTCVFVFMMIAFVIFAAPLFPVFNCAMALPPHLNAKDVDLVKDALWARCLMQQCPKTREKIMSSLNAYERVGSKDRSRSPSPPTSARMTWPSDRLR